MTDSRTIASIFRHENSAPAILTTASSSPKEITLAYADVRGQCEKFKKQAAALYGSEIPVGTVVSSLLPNGLACLLVFLATTLQRSVAAPLNPAMKQEEIEFYLEDADSKVLIVPEGTSQDSEGVRAARKLGVTVWTVGWNSGSGISVAALGEAPVEPAAPKHQIATSPDPHPEDVALLLHTSGTTGRPKAVPLTH
ncbi:hypothetical protein H4S06_005810, partial [Coemansia sp. BCRC 34490]